MLGKVGDGNVNTVSGLCVDTGFVGITVSTGFAGSTGPVIVLPVFLIVHFPIFLSATEVTVPGVFLLITTKKSSSSSFLSVSLKVLTEIVFLVSFAMNPKTAVSTRS